MAGEFLTDAEMAALEGGGGSSPNFLTDAQMDALTAPKPSYSGPTLSSDPIGALTSADWWMSRPSGEKHTFSQGLLGPLLAANNAINPIGDETVAGGSALLDYLGGKVGLNDPVSLGGAYDQRLAEARGAEADFDRASPAASVALDIAGALKLPTKLTPRANVGIGPLTQAQAAISNPGMARIGQMIKEGAGWGAAFGFGHGEAENRLEGALSGAKSGTALTAALGVPLVGAERAAQKLAPILENAGRSLLRKSVGARQSDYAKTAKELGFWNIADDELASATKNALDELNANGAFGKDRNPSRMLANITKQESDLASKVGEVIAKADKNGVRAHPDFEAALNYLAEGRVPADQVDRYMRHLEELSDSIKTHGKGKISYLQQQKIAAGSKYDPEDGPANGFWRAVYGDLQRTIEGAAPDVGPLNQQLQKYKIAKPILQRNLSSEEAKNWVGSLMQNLRTSGGTLTTPTLIASALGGGAFGPVGAAGGAALALAATPGGQAKIGSALTKASAISSKLERASAKVPGVNSFASRLSDQQPREPQSRKKSSTPLDKPTNSNEVINSAIDRAMTKIKAPEVLSVRRVMDEAPKIEQLVQAVIKQESAGKVRAVSNKGAQGLMQLMPETGKEMHKKLGLEGEYDPFDPEQNVILGTAYLKEQLETFKDPRLALAAYNMGPGALRKIINKLGTRNWDKIETYLKSKGMYRETVAYVPSVLKKLAMVEA